MLSLVVSASLKPNFVATGVRSALSWFSAAPRLLSSLSKGDTRFPSLLSVPLVNSLLTDKAESLKFVDVRAPEEYSKGHIPDAVNIHEIFTYLSVSEDRDLQGERKRLMSTFENLFQEAGINGDEVVITYEDNLRTMYGASCRGFYLLKLLGHPNVCVLNGGYEAWAKHGLPISTTVPYVDNGTFKARWVESMWSDKDDVAVAIKEKNAVLLDVRDTDEWEGILDLDFLTPRKGRLPGAVHILWQDFMKTTEDGMTYFREPEEIREICAAKGLTPESKVIVYCFSGVRASNTYLALKGAGFKNVTNYLGSWNEWSRDHRLEIDSKKLE